jgi:hypothetical protein
MANLVIPIWSTSPIWSSPLGQPDQFGQSDYVNLTNLVKLFDQIGEETLPIWSTNSQRFQIWSPDISVPPQD